MLITDWLQLLIIFFFLITAFADKVHEQKYCKIGSS